MRLGLGLVMAAGLLVAACIGMSSMGPFCAAAPIADHCVSWALALPPETLVGLALFAVIAAGLLATVALSVSVRHWRLSMALSRAARPSHLAGFEVRLVDGLDGPCVAGLGRPRIYCPADLAERLSTSELRAVVLHERHHQATGAPRRLLMLGVLAVLGGRFAVTRPWLERWRAAIEIEADDHALQQGATPSTLARAMLKLGPSAFDARVAGYASATHLRLRHLMLADRDVITTSRWPAVRLLGAAGVALIVGCWVGVLG